MTNPLTMIPFAKIASLADYRAHPDRAKMTDEDIEESVDEFIEGLREERREKTGSADCP